MSTPKSSAHSSQNHNQLGMDRAVERLNQWRDLLAKRGYNVGHVDVTSNRSAPRIAIELQGPVTLHVVARPTVANAQVSLNFNASSSGLRDSFLSLAKRPNLLCHLKDRTVKSEDGSTPYFYLAEPYDVAKDFDVSQVVAIISLFEWLLSH